MALALNYADTTLADVYRHVWHPGAQAVARMEAAGCLFDVERCRAAGERAAQDSAVLFNAWDEFAPGVNPNSYPQLEALFRRKKFPVSPVTGTLKAVKKTYKGEYPTGEAALTWLLANSKRPDNQMLLRTLMEYRKVSRLTQFLDKLPKFVCKDGYLRACFKLETGTGRLASSNPNLQNIPAGEADRYGIRSCFIAPAGERLLVADFAALEPRLLAHWLIVLWDDASLADAINSGDLYAAVAKATWPDQLQGIEPREIKEHKDPKIRQLRAYAKVIVLSTNYGKSIAGLAVQLGVPDVEAKRMRDDYFRAYPGIPRFQRWAADFGRAHGKVFTLLGRSRDLPGLLSQDGSARSSAERQATNSVIQGSAADVVMMAMAALLGVETLQLQVHDELVWRTGGAHTERLIAAMENPAGIDLAMPLKVTYHLVDNWGEAKS